MQIDASSTCKFLKYKNRRDADLAKACLSLKLVAMCKEDAQLLTALYRLEMDGGTIEVHSPKTKLKLKATLEGMRG